jgi:hypothetical protein
MAVFRGNLGEPAAPRYIVVSVVGFVIVAIELSTLVRWTPYRLTVAGLFVAFAVLSNASQVHTAAVNFRYQSGVQKAELAALELGMARAPVSYQPDPSTMPYVFAGPYAKATARMGSPAFPASALPGATPDERTAADRVLTELHGLGVQLSADPPAAAATCVSHGDGLQSSTVDVEVNPRGLVLVNRGATPLTVRSRRFSSTFASTPLAQVLPGTSASITPAPDASTTPWTVEVSGDRWSACPA